MFWRSAVLSITIDESTDTANTALLAVFVRGVNEDIQVVKNFVLLLAMMGTISGADILKTLLQCRETINENLSKLVSITTDEAPLMVGKKGAVSLFQKHMEDLGINNNITKLQCLIYQKALCAKISSLKSVMNIVVKVVSFIWSRGVNYRQFRQLQYFYKQKICMKTLFISAMFVGLAKAICYSECTY